MEDHPRLDIRVLSREGYLRPGEVTLVDLHWKGSRAEIASACLAIDMREGRGHEIRVAFDSPEGPRVQTLGLFLKAMGRRTRPFMVCSRTGEDVEVMPYRFGGFAQPAFLKLTYRTQLVPKSKRRKIKPGKTRVRPRNAAQ